jgi:multiple sugar transport system permease protein
VVAIGVRRSEGTEMAKRGALGIAATGAALDAPAAPTRRRRDHSATITFWLFVAPMIVGLGLFTILPIVWGFLLSLSQARNTISLGNWVGLQNYVSILRDGEFRESMVTIVLFTLFIVPLTFVVSLALAMLVNGVGHGTGFFRTVFFIPTAVSYVVASLVWRMGIFNGLPSGFANWLLYTLGEEPGLPFGLGQALLDFFGGNRVVWIGTPDPPWYWLVLVTVRLWLQVGFYMIIFIAGLQEIPRSLYEAAWVDGARTGWNTFRYITLPGLRNTAVAVLLLSFIAAFQAFDEFFNILGGTAASTGNQGLARPPLVYLYRAAFTDQDYGRGSAGAFILTALIIGVTLIQGRIFGFGRKA